MTGAAVLAPHLVATGCTSASDPSASSPGSPPVSGSPRLRVAVLGGGLAGLAAGITLLEGDGAKRFDVTLITMGHKLGGKVSGWRDSDGFRAWHGLHVIYGFYTELPRLLEEAGVNLDNALVSNEGRLFWYEAHNSKVNPMTLYPDPEKMRESMASYGGFTSQQRENIAAFSAVNSNTLLFDRDIEHLDEISFTDWCRQHGMHEDVLSTSWFRYLRDVAFNFPFEMSAFIAVTALRWIGTMSGFDYRRSMNFIPNGGWNDVVIEPLGARFEALGGKIAFKSKVTALHHERGRVTGINIATPQPLAGHCPSGALATSIDVDSTTNTGRYDFDRYICALPFDCLRELNPGDTGLWDQEPFSRIAGLRSVVSMAYQLYLREPIGLEAYPSFVNGLPEPMPFAIDLKNRVDEYRNDPRFGAVIDMVGQENGVEHLDDQQMKDLALGNLAAVGFRHPADAGIIHGTFRRNHSNHARYLLTEPGHLKHRPGMVTSFENFLLAGDWVRNDVEMPTMEGAVRTGVRAGRQIRNGP